MARVLQFREPNDPTLCPVCGSKAITKVAKLNLLSVEDEHVTGQRYRCADGHVFVVAAERDRPAASGE